jgi:transposase-like protein
MRTIPAGGPVSGDETQQFIQRVRRVTRRKFTAEEKIRIVLEGFRRETRVSDLCWREGINPDVYYAWLKEFRKPASRGWQRRRCGTLLSSRSRASGGTTSG